jgi:ATP-binding cassette subfamily F protein uup
VASHDRTFLDRTVDHVLAIQPGGVVERVPGGVAGWLAARSVGSSDPAPTPKGDTRPTRQRGPSPSTIGRRLRETEQLMTKLQRRIDRLHERLAGTTDHAELATVGAELAAAQQELSEHEDQWLALAERLG